VKELDLRRIIWVIYGYKVNIKNIDLYDEKFSKFLIGNHYRIIKVNENEAILGYVLFNSEKDYDNCKRLNIADRSIEQTIYNDVRDLFEINNFTEFCHIYSCNEFI